ncbi:hypothetical protein HMG95_24615, partial [Salmonella enterica subsp. enterica serovar Heidelberg]|nr:hypothetical protein [Salmonella enterica subsp. enterica serovar Heidelberg]
VSQGRAVDVASIAEPASFSDIPGRRNLISQAIDETLYRSEEGSTQIAVDTRALEQQASKALDVEQVNQLHTDIAGIERSIETLNQERSGVLNEQPSGSGRELSRSRAARQERLRDIDQRINDESVRLQTAKDNLAANVEGGVNFDALAELARLQQA